MMKQIALAAVLAVGAIGFSGSADAGYGHRSYGYKSYGYGHSYYKPVYTYKHYYKPVYTYKYYKPVCGHYGWAYKHGYKVWTCLW